MANSFSAAYSLASVLIAEIVMTFIFVLVVHGSTHERAPKGFAGIAIGLTLIMIHLVTIPIDGTSVNPARSLGPALFVGGTASQSTLGIYCCTNNRRNLSSSRLETIQINQQPLPFFFI